MIQPITTHVQLPNIPEWKETSMTPYSDYVQTEMKSANDSLAAASAEEKAAWDEADALDVPGTERTKAAGTQLRKAQGDLEIVHARAGELFAAEMAVEQDGIDAEEAVVRGRCCRICGDPMSERTHGQCRAQARAEAEEPEREQREGE